MIIDATFGEVNENIDATFGEVNAIIDAVFEPLVKFSGGSGGGSSGEQPILNSPKISVDNYNAMLTIEDDDNGNFVGYYDVYYANKYVGATTEKSVNLLDATTFNGDGNLDVIACGDLFNDSKPSTILWEQPMLYSPDILMDNMTNILHITDRNGTKASGFKVYVDGVLIVTTPDTSIMLTDYASMPTSSKTVSVVATGKDSYHLDSESVQTTWRTATLGTEGLTYSINYEGKYAICTGLGSASDSHIIIASWYEGYPVTEIKKDAFVYKDGTFNLTETSFITSVGIPEGIERIGETAFRTCKNITTLHLPSTLTYIGADAFEGSAIKNIYIPDLALWCNMEWVGDATPFKTPPILLSDCSMYVNNELLTDLVIPNGITVIENYRFRGISSITSLYIPDGVTTLGLGAFEYCHNLESVRIPKSVTEFGRMTFGTYTFSDCSALKEVIFAASVDRISEKTFSECPVLDRIALSKTVLYRMSLACEAAFSEVYYEGTEEEYPEGIVLLDEGATIHYNVDLTNFVFPKESASA